MIKRLKELRQKALAGEMLEARESKDGSWLIMLKMPDDPAMTHIPIVVATIPAEIGGYEPERRALAALIVETINNLDKLIAVCEAVQAEKKIRDDSKRMGGNDFIDAGGPEAHQDAIENLDKAVAALEEE